MSTPWHIRTEHTITGDIHLLVRYLDSFCIEHHLSTAETDVLKMLLQGMSNAEIAEARHVSLNTVKTHLSKIYSKSGIASRSRLLALIK